MIGDRPALYNKALLPAAPFIYYDNKLVTSGTWPDQSIKIAGVESDPNTVGNVYDYRKFPILRTQFRDNAKNSMFFGSLEAGTHNALFYTPMANCKNHGRDPETYLTEVIKRLPHNATVEQPADLTPARLRNIKQSFS